MDAVRSVGAAEYRSAPPSRVVFVKLYRPTLVVFPPRHYPTYDQGVDHGREALARVKRANLAMAAAIYSAKTQSLVR